MPTTYTASEALEAYIKHKEGCAEWNEEKQCYMPYGDSGGLSTIGYGHLITHSEAELGLFKNGVSYIGANLFFKKDLKRVTTQVNNIITASNLPALNQGQFDALVDFAWNCGAGTLKTVLGYGPLNFPEHCIRYVHDTKGNTLPGLVSRRDDEISWWLGSAEPSIA